MNSEIKTHVARGARSERSTCDNSPDEVVRKPIPPSDGTRLKLHIAPTRTNQTSQLIVVVFGALVIICVVMAAIVWWRLLT